MKMEFSEESIRKEIDDIRNKPPAFAAQHTYPYWDLDDRVFEIIVYQIFSEDIRTGHFDGQFDSCTLMTGVGEQGRDVKLLFRKTNAGLVQCKRLKGNFGRPEAAEEIIKFCLFALLDHSLISNPSSFVYYLAVANGFSGPAITLLDNFSEEIKKGPELQKWTENVLKEYKAFEGMSYADVSERLLVLLTTITIRKLSCHDLDLRLQSHSAIVSKFFAVRVVTDLPQTEELIRKVLNDYNLREVTDDDIRRLSERIAKSPKGERFDFGNLMLFGIHPDILNQASASGRLKKVATLGALFQAEFFGLTLAAFEAALKENIARKITPRTDISSLGKACSKNYLVNAFTDKFHKLTMGTVIASLSNKQRRVIKGHTVEAVIDEATKYCEHVLNKDLSLFASSIGASPLMMLNVVSLFKDFRDPDEARATLTRDFTTLGPTLSEILADVDYLLPKAPTVVFTDATFFDDHVRLKKVIDEAVQKRVASTKKDIDRDGGRSAP